MSHTNKQNKHPILHMPLYSPAFVVLQPRSPLRSSFPLFALSSRVLYKVPPSLHVPHWVLQHIYFSFQFEFLFVLLCPLAQCQALLLFKLFVLCLDYVFFASCVNVRLFFLSLFWGYILCILCCFFQNWGLFAFVLKWNYVCSLSQDFYFKQKIATIWKKKNTYRTCIAFQGIHG